MSQESIVQFGWVRSFFWPIHRNEYKKIIPMMLMLFLICLNYSILRPLKDAVVVPESGAKVIPLIKLGAILPMAILTTLTFSKLSNILSQEKVFYVMISGFLIFYALFAFVFYPYRELFHPHETARMLTEWLPKSGFFKGMIAIFEYWTYTLFYVMAELWSTIVMQVLFWGFANEVTRLNESRRFYGVLSVVSNSAAMIAGKGADSFTRSWIFHDSLPFGTNGWEQTQTILVLFVIASGLLTMGIFRWMNRSTLDADNFKDLHRSVRETKKKKRLSVRESIQYLSKSKYLLCIATLVVVYNLSINLVEVIWKEKLNELYTREQFYAYQSNLTFYFGFLSTVIAFFLPKLLQTIGWTRTALITPIILLVTSLGFFTFLCFENSLADASLAFFGTTPLAMTVFFGATQNVLSKACKYSVFDTTKEISFIPLGHESKLKGKAAIDGVGSRFGKSGSSLIFTVLFMFSDSMTQIAPIVMVILMPMILVWVGATRSLGKQFGELTEAKENWAGKKQPQPSV